MTSIFASEQGDNLKEIPLRVLIDSKSVGVDLFIAEGEGKYVLLCAKEYGIPKEKLQRFKQSNIQIYIREKEYGVFTKYLRQKAKTITSDKHLSRDEKSEMMYSSAEIIVEELFKNPQSSELITGTKEIAHTILGDILHDDATFLSMARVLSYDYYTYSHSVNVCLYAIAIGKKLSLSDSELSELAHGAILHDIGKSKISDKILNKEGPLDESEFTTMKTHTTLGESILVKLGEKSQIILDSVAYHHEKLDGGGYPKGLKDGEIPYYAQIIAVADVFDALTTKRSYKDALGSFAALRVMRDKMEGHLAQKPLNALILSFRP